nr:N-alpha-acetyltransferase 40 isoform X1 [Coffea arabica]
MISESGLPCSRSRSSTKRRRRRLIAQEKVFKIAIHQGQNKYWSSDGEKQRLLEPGGKLWRLRKTNPQAKEQKGSEGKRQILEKKKAADDIIRAASSQKDHLSSFPQYRHYRTNGLSVYLGSGLGDKLSFHLKQYIQKLLKVNMEGPYGSEWPTEEKVKRKEMVAPEARYIFVYEDTNVDGSQISSMPENEKSSSHTDAIVGFVHYRFIMEEEVPVLYVYELQLESRVQGKGLGKFLMDLVERIAIKNRVGAVMLTVQKKNLLAMNFYMAKLGYIVSAISPSRVYPLTGLETSYEILCKAFEAKSAFEESQ